MPKISPLSCVDPKACIAADVEIGPFCALGPEVVLGEGCRLVSHVVITGRTRIGRDNVFHPNSVIGGPPQDKKYRGEPTQLEIGDGNIFREGVTVNTGTSEGEGFTRVGSHNLLMANSHIGHDAQFADDCVLANNVMIAGHVVCASHVNMMGGAGVHHFVTIGEYAYIGGAARIHHDVPPYMKVDGADKVRGVNDVGLLRAGFSAQEITELEEVCRKLFYRRKPLARAMAEFDTLNGINPRVKLLVEFLRRRGRSRHGRYLESLRKV
ncbi:MAG TPA: acyl-ACP--UDP-N-acetylglucosamine O-acyltransferase [Tepidisphaeraceae bacterium]|jgi:UDP-N-acetylglucosamine acyltransferase|nr:acyl-ACP--UDP-N-acetylglucosamine O-acyltransferase [Tepidisphaeraceae bacterium]